VVSELAADKPLRLTASGQLEGLQPPTECACNLGADSFPQSHPLIGCVTSTAYCSVVNNTTCAVAGTICVSYVPVAGSSLSSAYWGMPNQNFVPTVTLDCGSVGDQLSPSGTATCDGQPGVVWAVVCIVIQYQGGFPQMCASRAWTCESL
jgi:hypothetical protein